MWALLEMRVLFEGRSYMRKYGSSTANQRAAQNDYYTKLDYGVPGFVFLKLCYLYFQPNKGMEYDNTHFF